MKKITALMLSSAMMLSLAACGGSASTAVSYTHLDVYKRQVSPPLSTIIQEATGK